VPQQTSRHELNALRGLEPGEQLLTFAIVVPAKSARGVKVNLPLTGRLGGYLGDHLMHTIGAESGGTGSIASGMPRTSGALLMRVTDRRVGLLHHQNGTPVWEIPRTWVARVERRPRLQLMARFRMHYADGSWLAFLTLSRRATERFKAVLGG
jgi:hypothetical protein